MNTIFSQQSLDSSTANTPGGAQSQQSHRTVQIAEMIAAPMFALSLLFLSLIAVLLVLGLSTDTNSLVSAATDFSSYSAISSAATTPTGQTSSTVQAGTIVSLLLTLWPVFWIEHLFSVMATRGQRTSRQRLASFLVCLVPPLRLAMPSAILNGSLWLPSVGWQKPGRELHRNLERTLSKPMLIIGLLILPVLLVEGSLATWLTDNPNLYLFIHCATGFIWFAFTLEFILMLNTTERKLAYAKSHWIELAIIVLPLVSFLRTLRLLPASRAIQVHKIAKMAKTYRMRGLTGRTVRALSLLEVVSRLRGENPQAKLCKLKALHSEKLIELEELTEQILELEAASTPPPKDTFQLQTSR